MRSIAGLDGCRDGDSVSRDMPRPRKSLFELELPGLLGSKLFWLGRLRWKKGRMDLNWEVEEPTDGAVRDVVLRKESNERDLPSARSMSTLGLRLFTAVLGRKYSLTWRVTLEDRLCARGAGSDLILPCLELDRRYSRTPRETLLARFSARSDRSTCLLLAGTVSLARSSAVPRTSAANPSPASLFDG